MAGYVCTSTLDLIKLSALKWKYYGWTTAPTNSNFFKIWISTIEVFQQVSLTLERCVLLQDSFCHDLEVHCLQMFSKFRFLKKTHVA